jgi:uncharacterized protein (TIGR04255 family)
VTKELEAFTNEELDEVFDHPPIREVAFEIRFAPRLRVTAELWRLQDRLVEQYPTASTESVFQPTGSMLTVHVFQNSITGRLIKISHENFVIAFTRYTRFEDFKEEVISRTDEFFSTFGVNALTRVGLRYVNNIVIPAAEAASSLLHFVRPLMDFDRIPLDDTEQFVNEVRMRYKAHMVTVRGVLLAPLEDRRRVYVLDLDCHSRGPEVAKDIPRLLDEYHDSAQKFFLDHVTEDYKKVMRGKQ